MIGRTISHYRIIAKLGEGGMGVVYRAEDTTLKRDVALKFLHPEMTRDPEAKARFLQEARAAAALNHPNICTVHEIGDAEGQTFIAMALIEGESLKDRIERGPLRLSDAVDLALQVSEGLAAAHKKGIVHRDMKPANVMVTAEGRARIMDFGLAKSRGQARLTRTGTTTGTIAYMSPEQSRGEDVDHRTDIWSFGVMLYEMVTGRRPFAGDYEQAVIYAIANAEPEPVTGLRTGVPMELERIVRKAMAKRAEERYQHADDVIADLKSLKRELDSGTATVSAIAAAPSKRRAGAAAAWRWAAVAAFAVVALAMVWMATRRGAPTPDLDPNKVVVAVFENRTGDPSLDPIGRMAAGSINEGLAKMGLVEVVPVPIGGEPRSEDAGDPASLAVATGAGLVISGAYYLSGDILRFQAELTDAREHKVVVTIPDIGGRRVSPTAAIEQLRQRAMGAVAVHMEPYSRWVKPVFPPTYDAYREYSVGMRLFGTDYPAAIQQFERAAALDTTFMMPRLYIATCYYNREEYARADSLLLSLNRRRERLSPHEGMFIDFLRASIRGNRGEEMRILRLMKESTPDDYVPNYLIGITALSLNRPREAVAALSAPVHELKDSAFYDKSWRFGYWADALHVLGEYKEELGVTRLARESYPDILWLLAKEARALVALGRLDEMEALIDESLAATGDRGSAAGVMSAASVALRVHVGRGEAIVMAERSVAERKKAVEGKTVADDWQGHFLVAATLPDAERWQEARELFVQLAEEEPDDVDVRGYLGVLAARLGDKDEARATLEDLRRLDRPYLFGNNTYWAACIAAQLGERERAVEFLQRALSQGYSVDLNLHADSDLEPLYGYPPFEELRRPKG